MAFVKEGDAAKERYTKIWSKRNDIGTSKSDAIEMLAIAGLLLGYDMAEYPAYCCYINEHLKSEGTEILGNA